MMIESNGGRATSNTTAPSVSANSYGIIKHHQVETYKPIKMEQASDRNHRFYFRSVGRLEKQIRREFDEYLTRLSVISGHGIRGRCNRSRSRLTTFNCSSPPASRRKSLERATRIETAFSAGEVVAIASNLAATRDYSLKL